MEQLRYAIYTRKSTEDEERQVLSLDSQRDKIKELFGNVKIVKEFRESKSAFEPDKRPQFKELLELIDAGKIDGIISWHPDRLSRNAVDAANITHRVTKGIIKDLKFASGFGFENSPESMMMLQMTMSQSQYYSSKLSKDVKRGNATKRSMGGLTGRAPEGYLNQRTSMVGRGEAIVIKDPERFELVRKAFDLFLTGEYSVQSVHKIMTDEWGYLTLKRHKSGGSSISKSNLYKMFNNVRYAGLIPDPYDPERFYKANFPAMITMEEYDKVQVLLGRKGLPRLASRKQFALRGFIRCGVCDGMVTAETKTKYIKSTDQIKTYTYYHCTGRKAGGCNQRGMNVREDDLYDQLLKLLDTYEIDSQMLGWTMDALRELSQNEAKQRDVVQASQNSAITNTQGQLDRLLDMATRGLVSDDDFKAKSDLLKIDLKQLHEEQGDVTHRVKNWYETATNTFEKLTLASDKFMNGELADKKDILLAIGQNPLLTDRKLDLTSYVWLVPVGKSAKMIRTELEKVRTEPQQIQKDSEESLRLNWCGRRESNSHRLLGRQTY
jgi:site-specific DNA recombinase